MPFKICNLNSNISVGVQTSHHCLTKNCFRVQERNVLENSMKISILNILTTQLQGMRNISLIDISQSREIIALTTRFKAEKPGHTQSISCHCFPHRSFTRHCNKGKMQ